MYFLFALYVIYYDLNYLYRFDEMSKTILPQDFNDRYTKMTKKEDGDISIEELKKIVEDSTFESTLFNVEDNNSFGHFSSVIKEIKGAKERTHLVKIRPPLFLLNGVLSNIARKITGMDNFKVLDNKKWQDREVKHLQHLHPEISSRGTNHDNAFLVEKIAGDVVYEILRSEKYDQHEKQNVLVKITHALKDLHDKDLYHGEPTTQNCILGEEGDIYWIDFEIEYHEDLSGAERKARDLEQLTLSILGAFEEEGEVGLDDTEVVDLVFDSYGDKKIISTFVNNPNIPLIGPHRVLQLSFVSLLRFYQVQINLMDYLKEYRD